MMKIKLDQDDAVTLYKFIISKREQMKGEFMIAETLIIPEINNIPEDNPLQFVMDCTKKAYEIGRLDGKSKGQQEVLNELFELVDKMFKPNN